MQGKKVNTKKVVFVANSIVGETPGISGGEVRFIEIAKYWARRGFEIHLLSSAGGQWLCQRLGLEVKLHCLSRSKEVGRLAFFGTLLKSLVPPRTLRGFDSGVVYCASEQIYDVLPGLWLKLRNPKRIKLAVVVHWLPPARWWQRRGSRFFNSFLFLLSERAGLFLGGLFADRLLAVSPSTKRQIESALVGRFFSKKVVAVKCGVNFDKIRKIVGSVRQEKYEAAFMKRIQAVKGIFDLIEVWEMVVRQLPQAKLIVIGSGIDEGEAKWLVKDKKLEGNVQFLGTVYDDEKKFDKIAESRLFLLPTYEENWAIVIGEAMAAGVSVISYGLKELKEVWGDNFVGVSVGDKEVFAKKVLDLLSDQPAREKLAAKALDYVKKFDWETVAKEELEAIGMFYG